MRVTLSFHRAPVTVVVMILFTFLYFLAINPLFVKRRISADHGFNEKLVTDGSHVRNAVRISIGSASGHPVDHSGGAGSVRARR